MNIACIACPARYAVPDEKIVGRKVRIGCKRCGTKLIVDGRTEPTSVRADTGVPSTPPEERYHLAISHDQRERGDVARIVELYGRGGIGAGTLAWREGMSQWLSLFEVEPIAGALRAAGYTPLEAGASGAKAYEEDDPETHVGAGYSGDDDEQTHVARSPLQDESAHPRFDDDEEEATTIFDSEAVHGGAWSEPASWRDASRQNPLGQGEWRERGQVAQPQRPSGQRSKDSALFRLDRLTRQKLADEPRQERAEGDFSDVQPLSPGPPVPAATLGTDLAVLSAPPPPAAAARVEIDSPPASARRRSRLWVLAVAVLLLGASATALSVTGRWPLVMAIASGLWQRVQGVR